MNRTKINHRLTLTDYGVGTGDVEIVTWENGSKTYHVTQLNSDELADLARAALMALAAADEDAADRIREGV